MLYPLNTRTASSPRMLLCLAFSSLLFLLFFSTFSFSKILINHSEKKPSESDLSSFEISDDSGQILRFKNHPQRIISLAPHITEIIFYIGQGDKLIGVDQFSNFPEQALHIPRIGSSAQLNLEEVLKLKPDLVIAWQSGNTAPQISRLKDFGIPIYYSEPKNLEDIKNTIIQFGLLTGAQKQANQQAKAFENKIKKFKESTQKNIHKNKIRVFYQVWQQPLMTLNGEHIVSEVIELCGGNNIFSELSIIAPQINIEAVIEKNPQLIMTGEKNIEQLAMWKQWPQIDAVQNNNFLGVNSDHLVRAGPRILLGAEKICQAIDAIREAENNKAPHNSPAP